jgi:anti-sigma B factor antagonist
MPSQFLKVSNLQSVNVVELALPDDLDSSEIDRLNEGLAQTFAPQPGARWVLDLGETQYMGSAVLGLIVNIRFRVKAMDGKLALCRMSARLHEIFRACCLEKLFTISRTREDAVKALR